MRSAARNSSILVVDVDGVLCDLVGSAIPVINRLFDCDLKRCEIRMFEMDKVVGVRNEEFNAVFRHLDYSRIPLIDGAAEGLAELATQFRIVVATNRPTVLHRATKKWLRDNDLAFTSFMAVQEDDPPVPKKSDLYPSADVVIDDDLVEVIAASEFTSLACLLDAPWNYSINAQGRFRRCRDWQDIVDACMSMSGRPGACSSSANQKVGRVGDPPADQEPPEDIPF